MGRPAKPDSLKELQGNPGKRRRARVDVPEPGTVAASRNLKQRERTVWDQVVPELVRLKFVRPTDVPAIERYCHHLVRWWQLTADVRREGETYVTESAHGTMQRLNPKFIARERIESRLEALEDRFGLNARSRQQILQAMASAAPQLPFDAPAAGEQEPATPLAGFLGGSVH